MKNGKSQALHRRPKRIELGQYIVADPEICHGKPTFMGVYLQHALGWTHSHGRSD
jgi:hypothetical protein